MTARVRQDRSVRNLACYLALGVDCDGEREVLGIWWQETEGAKFWLAVLNDPHRRGVGDVPIACVDGLKGFPEAIEATFPHAWVQTCVVHLIRASLRYVNYRDLKKVTAALRPIYTAANADAARLEFELSTSRAPFEHELLQAAHVRNRAKPRRDEQSSAGRTPAADRGRRVDRCPCAGRAG